MAECEDPGLGIARVLVRIPRIRQQPSPSLLDLREVDSVSSPLEETRTRGLVFYRPAHVEDPSTTEKNNDTSQKFHHQRVWVCHNPSNFNQSGW